MSDLRLRKHISLGRINRERMKETKKPKDNLAEFFRVLLVYPRAELYPAIRAEEERHQL